MSVDALELTRDLIAIDSVSRNSNVPACDLLQRVLEQEGFEVERLEYDDEQGVRKANLMARRGTGGGGGGLGFFSHVDTVPGDSWTTGDPWSPSADGDHLVGLGSCDMKGPLAATIEAAAAVAASDLKQPVYIGVTADEEVSGRGAQTLANDSRLFRDGPKIGVVAEPTRLIPVYAHKGGARALITANGRAAHSSTGLGVSANFLIAPFLAEMAELAEKIKTDEAFLNHEFRPPHNCLNMTLDDGGTRPNVTAPKTVCTLSFRPMPDDRSDELLALIEQAATRHGLEFDGYRGHALRADPQSEIVRLALEATGADAAQTVGFGTDGPNYQHAVQLVVLGPGSIEQAHTDGEFISVQQLREAVGVYGRMIAAACT